MTNQDPPIKDIEKRIAENMGCYYRVATKQWLKEINDPKTKQYSHLIDLTTEVEYTTQAINQLITRSKNEARGCVDCKKLRCENCERLWQS